MVEIWRNGIFMDHSNASGRLIECIYIYVYVHVGYVYIYIFIFILVIFIYICLYIYSDVILEILIMMVIFSVS